MAAGTAEAMNYIPHVSIMFVALAVWAVIAILWGKCDCPICIIKRRRERKKR